MNKLIEKYNVAVPRYTSYPTWPNWGEVTPGETPWRQTVNSTFSRTNDNTGISVYLHLPYCESLCTYCGCNKRITKNHKVERPYLQSLLQEWKSYLKDWSDAPRLVELHLGGGTPTFFQPENLNDFLADFLNFTAPGVERNFSFEGHPNNTSRNHLKVLYKHGFRRVSYGIQDFDPRVQIAIHRWQPVENVAKAVEDSREVGYDSINFDLVYGLPFQTLHGLKQTLHTVEKFMPERIAFYSYAHVPWKSPGQRGYDENDLPDPELKLEMAEKGREMFLQMGYQDIGMDHFALPGDALYQAWQEGTLNRNFMGYTTTQTELLLGLGASAISDSGTAYLQNEKTVECYQQAIEAEGYAGVKGHFKSIKDRQAERVIKGLICNGKIDLQQADWNLLSESKFRRLHDMQSEGLLSLEDNHLVLSNLGQRFVRNVCALFDQYMPEEQVVQTFSKAI